MPNLAEVADAVRIAALGIVFVALPCAAFTSAFAIWSGDFGAASLFAGLVTVNVWALRHLTKIR